MKLYIETLGCPKNTNDSEAVAGICAASGMKIISDPWDADAILINTCAFINDAKTESIETIFDAAGIIRQRIEADKNDRPLLIVSGCLSQRYGKELADAMPEVDIFVGVNDYEELPKIIEERKSIQISPAPHIFEEFSARMYPENHFSETLRIAEGCNNHCAYCVIPEIRGPFRSRPMENIIEEAADMASDGVREIILIAQDLTEYGRDIYGKLMLPELLRKLCRILEKTEYSGLRWIRLMYCYEDKITDELIDVIATEKRICNYIDIPIQHCSDSVLKSMKRRSTGESIRNTIGRLRKAIPDIHIRTTFIAGFPGETEDDFLELADFAEEMRFERLGVFPYSPEEGTVAGEMTCQIDDETKVARADSIMRLQVDISRTVNENKIGRILDVLVESVEDDGSYIGRTMYDAPEIDNNVIFTADSGCGIKPGQFVEVKITDAFDYDITGVLENE